MSTAAAPCEAYVYVHRSTERNPNLSLAWSCACGARSEANNHSTREAALDDWARHRDEGER